MSKNTTQRRAAWKGNGWKIDLNSACLFQNCQLYTCLLFHDIHHTSCVIISPIFNANLTDCGPNKEQLKAIHLVDIDIVTVTRRRLENVKPRSQPFFALSTTPLAPHSFYLFSPGFSSWHWRVIVTDKDSQNSGECSSRGKEINATSPSDRDQCKGEQGAEEDDQA